MGSPIPRRRFPLGDISSDFVPIWGDNGDLTPPTGVLVLIEDVIQEWTNDIAEVESVGDEKENERVVIDLTDEE